jgi:hypothetical protein
VTPLDFELETYGGTTGAVVAWVRVPALAGTTLAYMYYGGDRLDLGNQAAVWPHCLGVWHMSENGAEHDHTSHRNDLDATQRPTSVPGIAGRARGVDGTTTLAAAATDSLNMSSRSFSISIWVDVTQSLGQFDSVIYKGGSSDPVPGYDMEIGTQGGGSTSATARTTSIQISRRSRTSGRTWSASPTATRRRWPRTATARSCNRSTCPRSARSIRRSRSRVYDQALAPEWIAAEYRNLSDPTAFVQVGAAERAR